MQFLGAFLFCASAHKPSVCAELQIPCIFVMFWFLLQLSIGFEALLRIWWIYFIDVDRNNSNKKSQNTKKLEKIRMNGQQKLGHFNQKLEWAKRKRKKKSNCKSQRIFLHWNLNIDRKTRLIKVMLCACHNPIRISSEINE